MTPIGKRLFRAQMQLPLIQEIDMRLALFSAALFVTGLAAGASTTASAAGCGGYVNLAVWGCAPWDNNPPRQGVTPGYRAPAPKPAIGQPQRPIGAPQPNVGGRLITDNGAGILSDQGGGLRRN
jgi:hypothetical protein